jgi:hypothetical protein
MGKRGVLRVISQGAKGAKGQYRLDDMVMDIGESTLL